MKINADDGFNPELAENAEFSPICEMPDNIFAEYKYRTQFINYPDWISEKKRTGSHKPMQNMLNSI